MKKFFLKFTSNKVMLLLYFLLLLSVSMIVYTAVKVNSITYSQSLNYRNHIRYLIAYDNFKQGTDLLTEAVRRYVVTMKPEFIERYFSEALEKRHRDRALEMVENLQIDPSLKDCLAKAMQISMNLMDTEYHVMRLIALKSGNEVSYEEVKNYPLPPEEERMSVEQRHKLAEKLLWNDAYIRNKIEIRSYLASGLEKADAQAMARHRQLRRRLLGMLLLSAVSLIAMVLTLCGFVLYRRSRHEKVIRAQAEENARMNVQLKKRTGQGA